MTAHIFPLQGKAGKPLRVYVSVRNKGRNAVRNVGLRVSIPLEVKHKIGGVKVVPAFTRGEGRAESAFERPHIY